MFARRHWIPPAGLIFAQLCHGLSWILALWIALNLPIEVISTTEIAWIHLVALGWLTVTAFSILLHAIPAFTDARWRGQSTARCALGVAGAAVACFVAALLWWLPALGIVASVLAAALWVYLVTAWSTLGQAFRSADRVDRAVARAFAGTLAVFAIVILLGVALAWTIAGVPVPAWFVRLPRAHGDLAFFGWLTLLVYGVSARTLRPIAGVRSRWPKLHIVVGSATLAGAAVLAVGVALGNLWISVAGGALVAIGATCYIADVADHLIRATVPNRPPRAFVGAALFWLAVSILVGAGVLAGAPWAPAFGFLLLIGWIGQMVTAHMFHIGVRLIATIYLGDEDETRPEALLDARWPWAAFVLMQCAIALVGLGLLTGDSKPCAVGAALGLAGWIVTVAALTRARRNARLGLLLRSPAA